MASPSALAVRPARPSDEPAVLALLRSHPGLEVGFEAREFVVAERSDGLAACARLRRHPDGAWEIASVAVRADLRGGGIGARLVPPALAPAGAAPVYALALAPGFFAKHGFRPIEADALPPALAAKATGMCASTGFVAMRRDPS